MRIYLDTCCLQRPLDDQTQPRIRVETEAVFAILASVQDGGVTLLTSEALEFEIGRIPDEQRRKEAMAILTLAGERLTLSDPDGHFKFPHLWPLKLPQAGRVGLWVFGPARVKVVVASFMRPVAA